MDIWTKLKETRKPILLYGMGNGAEKILKEFKKRNISISGIFASDGFVRGNEFYGFKIISYSEIIKQFPDPIIILGFASHRADVIELICGINSEHELYAPDVPVYGDTLFDYNFYKENQERFYEVRRLLADDESKKIFDEVISYKLNGKIKHLFNAVSDENEVFGTILEANKIKDYADLGAYKGDTIQKLIEKGANLNNIYAFEPDSHSYKKLKTYCDENNLNAELYNACAYDSKGTLNFGIEGNRGSSVNKTVQQTKCKGISADSLDNVLNGRKVDYIKYDVEGSEYEALIGSEKTIKLYKPKLCVSIYHRSEDMFKLPLLVHSLNPDYKLYIRRFMSIPAWDLNLYSI